MTNSSRLLAKGMRHVAAPLRAIPFAAYLTLCPHFWLADALADDRQYELVIYACLQFNPTNCGEYVQPVADLPANPSAAYREAQSIVAKFMEAHPGLTLKGFDLKTGRGA